MTEQWEKDKEKADKYLSEIKQILGLYLIGTAPIEEDQERNTDLIVLRMEAIRIACRMRGYEYYIKWPDDITIRSLRPSGVKTELTKIVEGWGDYFFYGFSNAKETVLHAWRLCDLKVFRLWFSRTLIPLQSGGIPGIRKSNKNGSSDFRVFNTNEMPRDFIVADKGLS